MHDVPASLRDMGGMEDAMIRHEANTELIRAIGEGHAEDVRRLVDKGADGNAVMAKPAVPGM